MSMQAQVAKSCGGYFSIELLSCDNPRTGEHADYARVMCTKGGRMNRDETAHGGTEKIVGC